jgi:cytochrome c oxidase assembly protein subunit 11
MAVHNYNNSKLLWILTAIVIGMFGFGFALVPLYNTFCRVLGVNGKTSQVAYTKGQGRVDKTRWVTMQFVTTNNVGPWKFKATTKRIRVHPGEMKRVSFYVENDSEREMVVQAIPSVTPGIAAKYLKKTECFCFTQQTLGPHEAMDMPLLFHLDPELAQEVKTVTLSYTLYDVTRKYKN